MAGDFQPDAVRVLARRQAGEVLAQHKDYRSDFRQGWHEHPTASFDFVLRGGGSGQAPGGRIDSSPGSVEFFPAGARHTFACASGGIRTLHVVLTSEYLGRHGVKPDRPVQALPAEVFGRGCLRALRALHEPDDTGLLDLQSVAEELTGLLAGRGQRRMGLHARRAAGVLEDRAMEGVGLDELADAVGVNRGHLAREFRRAHGCSPGEYQRRIRLRRAAGMLAREPDEPIARVALACGFVDQAHLTNHFRRLFGVTPGRYRAALLGGDAA